mmetsp:Transcript_2731/g.5689  ORF Transcript_2731/g.5689 Transcript_2731/m.5689 type:complete len:150 (-) Transcript_2731:8-457(-)
MGATGAEGLGWPIHGAVPQLQPDNHRVLQRFEHRRCGAGPGCIATLVLPGLHDRRFDGVSKSDAKDFQKSAEQAACLAFKSDAGVNEIRRRFPPTMHHIRKFFESNLTQKAELRELGLNPTTVQTDISSSIYNGFRDLGCRTAIWDGIL